MKHDRIAVTGGAGLLGTHVLQRLAGKADLTSIDLKQPAGEAVAGVDYVSASITDLAAMTEALRGCSAVIHLAAIPNPREASASKTFEVNTLGTWTVLQAAEDAGVKRAVIASSDSAFGFSFNPPDWPPQFLPVDESHPSRPTEVYSLSKKVSETIAESFAARKRLEVLAIRPCHIVFPRGYGEIEARGADVQNYHFWAFVAPEDVAQGFDLAAHTDDYRGFEVYIIAGAQGMNARPTLDMAKERWGTLPEVRRPELYEHNPTASVLDTTKARDRLGYVPAIDRAGLLAKAKG
jgi:UDP-glucose 4-epimerase